MEGSGSQGGREPIPRDGLFVPERDSCGGEARREGRLGGGERPRICSPFISGNASVASDRLTHFISGNASVASDFFMRIEARAIIPSASERQSFTRRT